MSAARSRKRGRHRRRSALAPTRRLELSSLGVRCGACAWCPFVVGPRGSRARFLAGTWVTTTERGELSHFAQECERVEARRMAALERDLQGVLADQGYVLHAQLARIEDLHASKTSRYAGLAATFSTRARPAQTLSGVCAVVPAFPRYFHDLTLAVDVDGERKGVRVFQSGLPDVDHRQLPEGLDRRACRNLRCDFHECLRSRRLRARDYDWYTTVGVLADRLFERHCAEKRDAQPCRRRFRATVAEDLVSVPAVAADVPAHVFDEPEGRHVQLAKHLQRLDRDVRGDVLRSAHDRHSGQRNSLR